MAKLNDRELASIKLECLKMALQIHTNGIRRAKSAPEASEVIKTAEKFEKYITK